MKLPRWLSPVRTVEAETGWPRELCRRFSKHLEGRHPWRDSAGWFIGAVVAVGLWSELFDSLSSGRDLPWPHQITVAFFIVPPSVIAIAAALIIRRRRTVSALGAFRDEPWCFRCRYPVPSAALGARPCVCPECGESIPPEIAALAAERVGG